MPDPVLEQWRWTAFDRVSSLAGGVRDIFEDRDGAIWFATDNGAQRYDGLSWTTYTTKDGLAHNWVRTVMQTRDGAIWFGTWGGGISRYDGKTWTNYSTKDGLPNNFIWFRGLIQARDGAIWAGCFNPSGSVADTAGTQGGISRFDPSTPLRAGEKAWKVIEVPGGPPRPHIVGIYETSDGSLWFTTWAQGVLRFDGVRWARYTTADGLAGNGTMSIMESRDGSIWVACWQKAGISRFDPSTLRQAQGSGRGGRQWRTYTAKEGLPEGVGFGSLSQTENGTIWATGANGTLCRLDGERWKVYTRDEVPQLSGTLGSQATRGGAVWFYAWAADRAFRFDPKGPWTVYTHPDSLFGGFETADGSVWFGTRRAAVRLKDGLWTVYTPADGFLDGGATALQQAPSGALWFTGIHQGQSAVARYDRTGWKIFTSGDVLIDRVHQQTQYLSRYWPIMETRDGAIWLMGQYEGKAAVSRFDGKTWTRYTEADGLVGELVYCGYEAKDGTLWFGTWRPYANRGDGLFRFDGKAWRRYTEADGLSSSLVSGITEWPAGTLWAGTLTGISRLDLSLKAEKQTLWSKTDFPVDRPNIAGFVPLEDALWFRFAPSRRGGVVRYDGKTWRIYTEADGMASSGVYGIIRASDGALWFVGPGGISRFDGENWIAYTEKDGPSVRGTSAKIREASDGSFWIDDGEGRVIHFRYRSGQAVPETFLEPASDRVSSAGNILLRWSGRDRWDDTPPREMHYQWRMDGGAWSPWSGRTDQTFTELKDGKHTFEVRAVDRDGNVDPTSAVHAFVVEAPWWKNPYVLGLMAVMLGLAGVQTARVVRRDRRLREANAALSDANRDLVGLNRALTRERAVERVRAEVTAMKQAEDLKDVVQEMLKELAGNGVEFDLCVINIVDEGAGVRRQYGATKQGWSGQSEEPLSKMSEAFRAIWKGGKPVVREVDDGVAARHVETRRLLGMATDEAKSSVTDEAPTAIVDAPFAYGTLSLSTRRPGGFREEDLTVVEGFARVMALGYARYLDFERLEAQNRKLDESNGKIQEANRLKSQFLANMSHELRTPMNAIIGFTNLVLRRAGDILPERQRDNLTKVKLSADHLLNLINDILDLSKIEAGRVDIQKKWFDLRELIAGCCSTVSPLVREGVTLTHEVAGDVREACSDEARLRQVIINLLSNALKFTEQGEVRVTCQVSRATQNQPLDTWHLALGTHLVVAVSDTGIGIPADSLGLIFEEFRQADGSTTRQYGGTGLGLSITKKLTELLGGTIEVASEVGKGSTFTVRIPAVPDERRGDPVGRPPAPDPESTSAVCRLHPPNRSHGVAIPTLSHEGEDAGPGGGGRTIVSIDDDPNVAVLLREELASEGFRVVSALNAEEGVALVKKVRPAAVTVDIIMPGKDGWETIAMLKADPETRDIPVIVISCTDNRELGFKLGVSDYLVKPVSREALLGVMGRLNSGKLRDVLVVEDDPAVSRLMCTVLERSGFQPRSAANGQEALDEVAKRRPDAVLLDLMMPVMDGFEVVERLQDDPELRRIPVVVVTAKDLTPDEREFLRQRVKRVVQKGGTELVEMARDLRETLKG